MSALRVVIEFDTVEDYNEFLREHHAQRCTDVGAGNTYRIVEPVTVVDVGGRL